MGEPILRLHPELIREIALYLDLTKLIELCKTHDFMRNLCNNEGFLIQLTQKYLISDTDAAKVFIREHSGNVPSYILFCIDDYHRRKKLSGKITRNLNHPIVRYLLKYDLLLNDFIAISGYHKLYRFASDKEPSMQDLFVQILEKLDFNKTCEFLISCRTFIFHPFMSHQRVISSLSTSLKERLLSICFDDRYLYPLLYHSLSEDRKKCYKVPSFTGTDGIFPITAAMLNYNHDI